MIKYQQNGHCNLSKNAVCSKLCCNPISNFSHATSGQSEFRYSKDSLALISYDKFVVLPANGQGYRRINLCLGWVDIVRAETIAIIVPAVA